MKDGSEIEKLIGSLEALVDEAEGNRNKWKDVWNEIKNIGQEFKESRFPTRQAQQESWNRFQSIIEKVKTSQETANKAFKERMSVSEEHLNRIISYSHDATPTVDSDFADTILTLLTGGAYLLLRMGIEAILGPFDERESELRKCNEIMKEGWAYLSNNKSEMLGKHKQEAYESLNRASESLSEAWSAWKNGKEEAIDRFRAEKQAAWEEKQAKHEEWEMRTRERLTRLKEKHGHLEDVLERCQSNLSELEEKRDSAWSDSYRERVEEWIGEEEERIDSIKNRVQEIEELISDLEEKLDK